MKGHGRFDAVSLLFLNQASGTVRVFYALSFGPARRNDPFRLQRLEESKVEHGNRNAQMNEQTMRHHYMMFGLNAVLSFIIMYVGMFAMIWSTAHFFNNLNMVYMSLIMLGPMTIVMLLTMGMMLKNMKLNMILYAASTLIFLLSFSAMRAQGEVGDRQFIRAMIPHHSGAILMCNRASLRDQEIRDICFKPNGIVDSQTREITQMKQILQRL